MPEDRTKPPTKEDLQGLPPTAIVAFAARCARRVQPVYTHFMPREWVRHVKAIEDAIALSEAAAATPKHTGGSEFKAAIGAASNASKVSPDTPGVGSAASTAIAAASAAQIISFYPPAANGTSSNYRTECAAEAAAHAAHAAKGTSEAAWAAVYLTKGDSKNAQVATNAAVWHDLEQLRKLLTYEHMQASYWPNTLGPPVKPVDFGPLWPNGEPNGWPSAERQPQTDAPGQPPSAEDLKGLPPTAIIAFAARCARRVYPLIKHFSQDASEEHAELVDRLIRLVEKSAIRTSGVDASELRTLDESVQKIYNDEAAGEGYSRIADAILTAHCAAYAAIEGTIEGYSAESASGAAIEFAWQSAATANQAAGTTAPGADEMIVAAMRLDLALLRSATASEEWHHRNWPQMLGPSVPPEFFGPLWPEGEPEGWPSQSLEDFETSRFVLEVQGPPGVSAQDVVSRTAELIGLIDRYNRSIGGNGVVIDDDIEVHDICGVDQPVFPTGGRS